MYVALPVGTAGEPTHPPLPQITPSTTVTVSFAGTREVINDNVEQPLLVAPGNLLSQGTRVVRMMVDIDVRTLV